MEKSNECLIITFERNDDNIKTIKDLNIQYPMYFQYYEDALNAVLQSVRNNTLNGLEKNVSVYGNNMYSVPLYENNLIAFTGKRGCGKTTAITEFGRILSDYYGSSRRWELEIDTQANGKGKYSFHVLPPIDASMLSAKEDLVEVILAQMYQLVIKEQQNCKEKDAKRDGLFRRVIGEFDSVCKDYRNVGNYEDQNNLGNSVLVKLRNVSDSLRTKTALEKLTESSLQLLEGDNYYECESYLVVIVDDLDMNPRNAFEMLDQLYKYFSHRKVIVLVAIDYEQMYLLCQRNFVDILIPEYGSTHKDVYVRFQEKARKLANDYLLKVLPMANRIYLPERNQLYPDAMVQQGKKKKLPIKEFLFKKIAEKTNIHYDACGLKKHFCLPDTVRELVSYNAFLDSLFSLDKIEQKENVESGRQMVLYDQNHERFNKDIEERMAMELLDDRQLMLYQSIMRRHIERRAGYMKCFVEFWMKDEAAFNEERVHPQDVVDEQDFCYTDLIEVLYKLGRRDYSDKVLVHCILASFTSEMVRECYSYQYNTGGARERAARRMRTFLGTTFGGEWMEESMPNVVTEDRQYMGRLRACYIKSVTILDLEISIDEADLEWEEIEEWLPDILLRNLPYVECVSLLFANAKDEAGRLVSPEWKFVLDVREQTDEGKKAVLNVKGTVDNACFDMFGFLGREVKVRTDGSMYDKKLFQELERCAADYCIKNGERGKWIGICQNLRDGFRRSSIWYGYQGNMAFPYFDFDMAYNIVKRVRKKMAERGGSISESDICEYYRTVYGYIADCLLKEEKYYKELFSGDGDNEDRAPKLTDNFLNTPFIKAFGVQDENGESIQEGTLEKEKLNLFLLSTIKSLSLNVIQSGQEEEPE